MAPASSLALADATGTILRRLGFEGFEVFASHGDVRGEEEHFLAWGLVFGGFVVGPRYHDGVAVFDCDAG
jgi:hypothetical protein